MKRYFLELLQRVEEDILQEVVDKKTLDELLSFSYFIRQYFEENAASENGYDIEKLMQYLVRSYTPGVSENIQTQEINFGQAPQGQNTYKDYRIKELQVVNFRKFGRVEKPCGLKFYEENKGSDFPKSTILVGNNSVGKSSLYNALEYVLTGNISEAKLRAHDVKKFASHSGLQPDLTDIMVTTVDKECNCFSDFVTHNPISMEACFCSEYDITNIGAMKYGNEDENVWNDFFLKNLGWGEIIKFRDYFRGEKKEKLKITDDLVSIQEKIIDITNKIVEKEQEIIRKIKITTEIIKDKNYQSTINTILTSLPEIKPDEEFTIQSKLKIIADLKAFLHVTMETLDGLKVGELAVNEVLESDIAALDINFRKLQLFPSAVNESMLQADTEEADEINIKINSFDPLIEIQEYKDIIQSMLSEKKVDIDIFESLIELSNEREELVIELQQAADMSTCDAAFPEVYMVFTSFLDKAMNKELGKLFPKIKKIIKDTIEHFMKDEPEKKTISIDEDAGKISIWIDRNEGLTPKKYFNTFRYKLFCMMVKISTAISLMECHKINFPIILDDVFYASDYQNRLKIKKFMEILLNTFKELKNREENLQIQLICFTHDELVMEAIRAAVVNENMGNEFIFGRLIDYNEIINASEFLKTSPIFNEHLKPFVEGEYHKLYMKLS